MASTLTYDVTTLPATSFFGYEPSIPVAGVAAGVWLATALLLAALVFRYKRARYSHLIDATALMEFVGYIAIIVCSALSGKSNIFPAYVVSQVFIILAPNLLQAVEYITIARVLAASSICKDKRYLSPRGVEIGFVTCDVIGITIQSIGTAIWASSKGSGTPNSDQVKRGYAITIAGLAFQLVTFAIFLVLAIWTHLHRANAMRGQPGFRGLILGLYTTMALVSLRNVFRFVEFMQLIILPYPIPEGTYVIMEQEVLFYTLDALPIFLTLLVFIALHPSRLLPPKHACSKEAVAGKESSKGALDLNV